MEPHLRPLCHLPLRAAGGALAGAPLQGALQVGHGAEVTVDGAVQARGQHLPAADLPELEALTAGPGALAPAARLPPGKPTSTSNWDELGRDGRRRFNRLYLG